MEKTFSLIFHGFIILGICGLGFLLFEGVHSTTNRLERLTRGISLATGVFVYGSARAMGISLTTFVASAVDSGRWFSFFTLGTVLPGILGILCAKFVVTALKSANYMALRVIIFAGSLILLQFADLYIETGLKSGLDITRRFAPNLIFLACLGMYVIFRFHPKGFNKEDLEPK
jgi:hypothetical protein